MIRLACRVAGVGLILAAALVAGSGARGQDVTDKLVYLDPTQPIDKRVEDLISRLTIQEKAMALYHKAPANPRLKIPMWGGWNQSLHGVWSKTPTTEFPVSIAMAATWDPALVKLEAGAISDEARALYNIGASGPSKHGLVYRAPVINICRDPRWGRIQECYGEDPFLTGRMGVAYVQGLQGDDPKYLKVAATLKHFAVNNVETGRLGLSADVPERILHEYWLPHFRACVVEGKAASVMAAYNAINGTPCAMNRWLLTDILKGDWGFEGFVTSDLDGVKHLMDGHKITQDPAEAVARALLAGCDVDDEQYRDAIPSAVEKGLIKEKDVDAALRRVLKVGFRLGAFDPADMVPWTKIPATVIDSAAHRALARRAEEQAIVLLQNHNNFLPVDRTRLTSLAVIGPFADQPEYGNYFGAAPLRVGPLQGIKNKVGDRVQINYAKGCDVLDKATAADIDEAVQAARQSDVAMLFLGTSLRVEAESRDRTDINLPGSQERLLEEVLKANPRTVVVLLNAGPLATTWARDHVPAILEAWYPGEEGGNAIADVLFGDWNPSGKLPYTAYESLTDVPEQNEYDISKGFTYMYNKAKPLYPFGHGLSYTTFEYSGMKVAKPARDGSYTVSVAVKNTGWRMGAEVVQAYTHVVGSAVSQPQKRLVAFGRVVLKPNESKVVTMNVPPERFAYYSVEKKAFLVEPGKVEVMVGSSSADIRATGSLQVDGALEFRP